MLIERDEYVIVDMEAGLEHLGRGSTAYIDAFIVVVEPGQRSFRTARDVKKLASDLGVAKVYVAGNKVAGEEDAVLIKGPPQRPSLSRVHQYERQGDGGGQAEPVAL